MNTNMEQYNRIINMLAEAIQKDDSDEKKLVKAERILAQYKEALVDEMLKNAENINNFDVAVAIGHHGPVKTRINDLFIEIDSIIYGYDELQKYVDTYFDDCCPSVRQIFDESYRIDKYEAEYLDFPYDAIYVAFDIYVDHPVPFNGEIYAIKKNDLNEDRVDTFSGFSGETILYKDDAGEEWIMQMIYS